ncbi:MAG: branched-chain amino acid ABC transporter substrate-binding protein [Elusimicrobiota bacterium]|nr:branched-chain amino acid ABC transporter substrate-binding protein [Elusimicrobiota bacterium]
MRRTACLAAAAAALLACGRAKPPVKLAVITTLSGPGAPEGNGLLRAVTLAVEDAGGVAPDGRPVVVESFDDRGEAEPAREAARAVVNDPAFFAVVGPYFSVPAAAAGRALAYKGVVMLTSAGSSVVTRQQEAPEWREQRVIFQMTATSSRQGDWDAEYAVKRLGLSRVAVAHDGGAYGIDIAGHFAEGLRRRGVEPIWQGHGGPGAAEREGAAAAVAVLAPELVFFGGLPPTTGDFMKAARAAGYAGRFMAGGGARQPLLFDHAGPAADGALVSMQGLLLETMPAAAEFVARYRARFGQEPGMMDHYAYDATRIALWAVKRTGGDRTAASAAIRAQAHETMMGTVNFDAKGTAMKGLVSMTRADAARRAFPPADL